MEINVDFFVGGQGGKVLVFRKVKKRARYFLGNLNENIYKIQLENP